MRIISKINSARNLTLILIIVVVGFVTFANMLGNSFVWDDEEMVVKNAPLLTPGNIPNLFTQATFHSGGSGLSGWFYRPIVMLVFLFINSVFGLWAPAFHFVQLLFHLAVGSLLFLVFEKVFLRYDERLARPLAFVLAIIFVVHPAHVESISYISTMGEPIYSLLLLIVLLLVFKNSTDWPQRNLAVVGGLYSFAFLTKEAAAVFLPIILLWVLLFNRMKRSVFLLGALTGGAIAYFLIRFMLFGFQSDRPQFITPISDATFGQRLITGVANIYSFLSLFLFPKSLSIAQHHVVASIYDQRFILGVLTIAVLLLSAVLFWVRKLKIGLFFLGWFVIAVIPVSNIFFPLDMSFAERWMYFPMIGLLGACGTLILHFRKNHRAIMGIFYFLVLTAFLFSVRTIVRNRDWRDGSTLYWHDLTAQKENFDLENNVGVELFRQGRIEEAKEYFEKSVSHRSIWYVSNNNLGAVHERLGDLTKARFYYEKSVDLSDYYLAYENLSMLLARQEEPERALPFLEMAIGKFPNNASVNAALAITHYRAGSQDEALAFARRGVLLDQSQRNLLIYETILNKRKLEI